MTVWPKVTVNTPVKNTRAYLPLKSVTAQLWRILCTAPTDPVEILISLNSLFYGIWFLVFCDSLGFPAWQNMGQIMPHIGWGSVLVLTSLWELWTIGSNHRYRNKTILIFACLWLFIAVLIVTTNAHDPPFISAFVRFCASVWVYLRRREE